MQRTKTATDPIARDCEMARHPERWPNRPFLPLEHKTRRDEKGDLLLGFILEPTTTMVYVGCMFAIVIPTMPKITREEYDSIEALFDAGWQVD